MLSKRTNILFEENLWKFLVSLAKSKNTSVGKLIRQAVREKYINKEKEQKMQAVKEILSTRKVHKGINYQELIEDGRKY